MVDVRVFGQDLGKGLDKLGFELSSSACERNDSGRTGSAGSSRMEMGPDRIRAWAQWHGAPWSARVVVVAVGERLVRRDDAVGHDDRRAAVDLLSALHSPFLAATLVNACRRDPAPSATIRSAPQLANDRLRCGSSRLHAGPAIAHCRP